MVYSNDVIKVMFRLGFLGLQVSITTKFYWIKIRNTEYYGTWINQWKYHIIDLVIINFTLTGTVHTYFDYEQLYIVSYQFQLIYRNNWVRIPTLQGPLYDKVLLFDLNSLQISVCCSWDVSQTEVFFSRSAVFEKNIEEDIILCKNIMYH